MILDPHSHRAAELSSIHATVPTGLLSQTAHFLHLHYLPGLCRYFSLWPLTLLIHLTHAWKCTQTLNINNLMLRYVLFDKMKQMPHQEIYILSIFWLIVFKILSYKTHFKKVKLSFLCKVFKIHKVILHRVPGGLRHDLLPSHIPSLSEVFNEENRMCFIPSQFSSEGLFFTCPQFLPAPKSVNLSVQLVLWKHLTLFYIFYWVPLKSSGLFLQNIMCTG